MGQYVSMPTRRRVIAGVAAAPFVGSGAIAATPAAPLRIRATFNSTSVVATLLDSPTTRDLLAILPFAGTIDDFSTNEKIAYLPRKLNEQGSGPFGDEAPGDLCYWAPWDLAFFHARYTYSEGLIRLGQLDTIEPLLAPGAFPLRVELKT